MIVSAIRQKRFCTIQTETVMNGLFRLHERALRIDFSSVGNYIYMVQQAKQDYWSDSMTISSIFQPVCFNRHDCLHWLHKQDVRT